jgi:hypothetical protein
MAAVQPQPWLRALITNNQQQGNTTTAKELGNPKAASRTIHTTSFRGFTIVQT